MTHNDRQFAQEWILEFHKSRWSHHLVQVNNHMLGGPTRKALTNDPTISFDNSRLVRLAQMKTISKNLFRPPRVVGS